MPSYLYRIGALTLGVLSFFVHAKGERYGGIATISGVARTDEVGQEKPLNTPNFGLVHTRPIDENNNRWRWWIAFNYLSETIKPSKEGLYQEMTGFEVRVMPQYAMASWGPFTPYLGAGISIAHQSYSNRWNLDDQGYKYGDQLEDISKFGIGALMGFGTVMKISPSSNSSFQFIPQISYLHPINGGLGGLEFSLLFLF